MRSAHRWYCLIAPALLLAGCTQSVLRSFEADYRPIWSESAKGGSYYFNVYDLPKERRLMVAMSLSGAIGSTLDGLGNPLVLFAGMSPTPSRTSFDEAAANYLAQKSERGACTINEIYKEAGRRTAYEYHYACERLPPAAARKAPL